jgi:hypothetical protein
MAAGGAGAAGTAGDRFRAPDGEQPVDGEGRCRCGHRLAAHAGDGGCIRCTCVEPAASVAPDDGLREALRTHHPIMRSETGPFSGCRCGGVKLGQDVIEHVVGHLRRALDGGT